MANLPQTKVFNKQRYTIKQIGLVNPTAIKSMVEHYRNKGFLVRRYKYVTGRGIKAIALYVRKK